MVGNWGAVQWPFGLRIFRGTTGLHVAHRTCFARRHRPFIFAGNRFRKRLTGARTVRFNPSDAGARQLVVRPGLNQPPWARASPVDNSNLVREILCHPSHSDGR
jgi:hypothetical protein